MIPARVQEIQAAWVDGFPPCGPDHDWIVDCETCVMRWLVGLVADLSAELDQLRGIVHDALPALGYHGRDFSQRALIEACDLLGEAPEAWTAHLDVLNRLRGSA